MQITRMRTNRMKNPLGFQMDEIRVSYVVEDCTGGVQAAAQILVAADESFTEIVYDSQVQKEIDSISTLLPFSPKPRTRYYWKVRVWADDGDSAESPAAWFETAKSATEGWQGYFITQTFSQAEHPLFQKEFMIEKAVRQARFYGVGLGVYELYLNGEKVGDEFFLPGTHSYDNWIQYQTFILEVKAGMNRLTVMTGDGWYKGPFGLKPKRPRHGEEHALIGEIHLLYEDGTTAVIGTDESWTARKSKVVFDSIYDGEVYDETVSQEEVFPVQQAKLDTSRLQPRLSPKIVIHERLKPVSVIHTPAGETVLDMGQNMVGFIELFVDQPKGQKLRLLFGEILQQGNFYQENLRKAHCEYTYISDGTPQTARAHFSFYGFRYVKLEGFTEPINPEAFTGCVIHSQMEETGHLETSDPQINRLLANVRWGQKGNFLDTPTDCPQRDERLGWTGDAQIFADTACYNMDTYAFYIKYMKDLAYEQKQCGGSVPYVVPMSRYELNGASAWGDAATIIPWTVYLHSGDQTILKKQYPSMKAWVEYIKRADDASGSKRLWQSGRHFGDWLALDGKVEGGVYGSTDKFFIASAYYYYSTLLTAKSAAVLGYEAEAKQFHELAAEIKQAFLAEYFTKTGRLSVDTQTAYALVIYLDLIPVGMETRLAKDFKEKMKENGFRLNTGFVGTPYLCPALSKCGRHELACDLLMNEDYPGWLYEVKMGATTIWERWNSVLPDGSISGTGMNSLNHYAYGSIAGWMYRYLLGLQPQEEAPGFRKAWIAPKPTDRLGWLKGSLKTPAGTYRVSWSLPENPGGKLTVSMTIPFGAEAVVTLPRAAKSKDLSVAGEAVGEDLKITLKAGTYTYAYTPSRPYKKSYGMDSNLNELMALPMTRDIILRHFPLAAKGIPFQGEGTIVDEIATSPFGEVSDEALAAMRRELEEL